MTIEINRIEQTNNGHMNHPPEIKILFIIYPM